MWRYQADSRPENIEIRQWGDKHAIKHIYPTNRFSGWPEIRTRRQEARSWSPAGYANRGDKSLRVLGTHILNMSPKFREALYDFRCIQIGWHAFLLTDKKADRIASATYGAHVLNEGQFLTFLITPATQSTGIWWPKWKSMCNQRGSSHPLLKDS
jgi:hypothetical protein